MTEAEIVNVVGGGDLEIELDLTKLSTIDSKYDIRYEPERFPGLIIKLTEPESTCMLFSSGKYNIAGSSSIEDIEKSNENFVKLITDVLERETSSSDGLEIRNVVLLSQLSGEIDLEQLAVALGVDNIEYEAEQFPGLIYRKPEAEYILFIFTSGKVILTGTSELEKGRRTITEFIKSTNSLIK